MKPDTFDIPAYQFAILNIGPSELDYKEGLTPEIVKEACEKASYIARIPFEYVDGLTIGEVIKFSNIRGPLILSCYVGHESFYPLAKGYNVMLWGLFLDNKYIRENQEKRIDQAFEEQYEVYYRQGEMSKDQKKVARCFFERYQDKSHEATVDRIKRLEKTKNN